MSISGPRSWSRAAYRVFCMPSIWHSARAARTRRGLADRGQDLGADPGFVSDRPHSLEHAVRLHLIDDQAVGLAALIGRGEGLVRQHADALPRSTDLPTHPA